MNLFQSGKRPLPGVLRDLMPSSGNPLGFHAMIVSVSPVGILNILEASPFTNEIT